MRGRKKIIIPMLSVVVIGIVLISFFYTQQGYRLKYPFASCSPKLYYVEAKIDGDTVKLNGALVYSNYYIIGYNYRIENDTLYLVIYSKLVGSGEDPQMRQGGIKYDISVGEKRINKIVLVGGMFDKEVTLYP